jgi:amino acid transporter
MTDEDVKKEERPLGFWSLLALGINGIVGVGIFFAPSEIATLAPGWGSLVVLTVTGVALFPVALAVSKMGSRIHEDGGPVLYARLAFGEMAGFIVGWLAYASALFSAGTVMVGIVKFNPFVELSSIAVSLWALALVTMLALVCSTGVKVSARVWSVLTVLKLMPLVLLAFITLYRSPSGGVVEASSDLSNIHWFRACLKATFVFQGFEIVPVIAGQARSAGRNIPPAVIGSLVSATVIYLVLQRGAVRGVPHVELAGAPLVATAEAYAGHGLGRIISIGTSVSALGIAFGMVATTPRYLSALATGTRFATVAKNGVPMYALLATWAAVGVLVFLGKFGELLTLSSIAVVMQYLIVALALLRFGITKQRNLQLRDAWSAIPTILVAFALLSGANIKEWAIAGLCAATGVGLRFWHQRVSSSSGTA